MATAPVVSFEDLDNSVRNGKKKLYWSAFEVVLATAQPGGAAPLETRYDAYQVNHNHLKKLHAGARGGPHYVRVECKYCTAPRFTQSITVSTKKFEEHYMTLHALDALASADAKKAQQLQRSRHNGKAEDDDQDDDNENEATGDEAHAQRPKRGRKPAAGDGSATSGGELKRPRRGATARDDDAMQGAAAAVVALSGGASATRDTSDAAKMTQSTSTTLPSSLVDSSILLDPADSDTKRAKKSYWTAYEVVICERVPPSDGGGDDLEGGGGGETVVRETRQDAWRVNHNALRRLHLDADRDTTVRVECRFCDEPKFNQSITVSTRKFEQHYYYEHGDENQRQELEARLAARAAESASVAAGLQQGDTERLASALEAMPSIQPRRRKSWKALLLERENSTGSTTVVPTSGNSRSRFQRALLLNWLVQETLPLSAVAGSDHFQAFVSSLDRKCEVPSLPSLSAQLQQRAAAARASVKTAIQDEIASAEAGTTAFALTIDTFPVHTTSDQSETAFVSVTVHYVSRVWERQQLLLACRAVPVAASHESVWAIVRDVLDEFGIPTDVVVSATVRDADAMGVATAALASGDKPTGRDPAAVVVLCAAGALHSVAEAGMDAIRRSTVEPLKTLLQQQEGLAAAHSWMDFSMALSTMEPTSVSTETLAIAHAVVALLEPFVRVAHELSTTTAYPTMAMVFQYFRHLNESLAELKHSSKDALAPVIKAMHASLDGVFDKVVSTNALVAYVLDPRFRFANISSVDEKRVRARLTEEIAAITGGGDTSTSNESVDTRAGDTGDVSTGSISTTRQTRSLFEELATSGKRTSVGGSTTPAATNAMPTPASGSVACSELVEYLALDDEEFSVNVLQWWQTHEAQFPTLARVARQYLALVGTSLPADELFTVAGRQRVVRRSGLDVEMLEATVLVRAHPEQIMEQIPLSQPARADAKRRKPMGSSPVEVASAPVPPGLTLEATAAEAADKASVAIVV